MKRISVNLKIYLMEAACLGLFMISASFFGTLLEYPESLIHQQFPNAFGRLCIMGVLMGLTIVALIYSPMGKLSGAHMNPAFTLVYYLLGKVDRADAFFYILFQCAGGFAGVMTMDILIGEAFEAPPVNYLITVPGKRGATVAFVVEMLISFGMMLMVLVLSNSKRISNYTGFVAGLFVMVFLIVSAPVSGFSMNPARTLASAIPSRNFIGFWIYCLAPVVGMGCAALLYTRSGAVVKCAKLHHSSVYRCLFNCRYCGKK